MSDLLTEIDELERELERLKTEKASNEDLILDIQERIRKLEALIADLDADMIDMRNEHSKLMSGL